MKLDLNEFLKDQNEIAAFEQKYHDYIKKDPGFMDEAIERLTKSYAEVLQRLELEKQSDVEARTRAVMRDTFGDVYGGLEKLVIQNHNRKGGA
tara:strand:+ start:270 stop:548 length:279 start_codon:yes stop_codon:yes gene_type:complete